MSPLRLAPSFDSLHSLRTQLAQGGQPGRRWKTPQRHTCHGCGDHPARFRYKGEVRADRDHTLCFRCYRAEMNRQRARRMAA